MRLSIEELIARFPDFRVAFVVAEPLRVAPSRSAKLKDEIAQAEGACRRRWGDLELAAIPQVAAWRTAYKGFGVKKTSYRSSVERLIKRVTAGGALPEINVLVDLYNLVSLASGLCVGCDDLDRTFGDLAFRYSRANDSFIDMGAESGEDPNDPPKPGEVVYADERHILCRRWNWRQDARTAAGPQTLRAVLTVQGNGAGDVESAAERLTQLIARECGGSSRVALLDAKRPSASL